MQMPRRINTNLTLGTTEQYRYAYTGKEVDGEISGNGNSYDFGNREYDPRLGRWFSLDPLKKIYPSTSPFCYALNTPIMAKDPDGRFTIFINGFTGGLYGAVGLTDACPAGKAYWGEDGFIQAAQVYLGDEGNQDYYRNGSDGQYGFSTAKARRENGKAQGEKDAADIMALLAANSEEKLNIVAHSMGSAYAEGYIDALVKAGVPLDRINKIIHLSAADPSDISISSRTKSIHRAQLNIDKDWTLYGKRSSNPVEMSWETMKAKDAMTKGKDRMIKGVDVYGEIHADPSTMIGYDTDNNYNYHNYTKSKTGTFDALTELDMIESVSSKTYQSSTHKRTFYTMNLGDHKFEWNFIKREGGVCIENGKSDGTGSVFQGERIEICD